MTPTAPNRGSPRDSESAESPVRTFRLFPDCDFSDDVDETKVSDVEALGVMISSIEERMDTFHNRLVKLEKGVKTHVGTLNRVIMVMETKLTKVSDVEALEVMISSNEERMDTFHDKLVKLEKDVKANVDTINCVMMVINIAIFAHLAACYL